MLKFNVYFNYKNERRRAWLLLIMGVLVVGILLTTSILILDNVDLMASPIIYFVSELFPYFLRLSVWIVIDTTFIIFIRNLYDRFVALNSLLR